MRRACPNCIGPPWLPSSQCWTCLSCPNANCICENLQPQPTSWLTSQRRPTKSPTSNLVKLPGTASMCNLAASRGWMTPWPFPILSHPLFSSLVEGPNKPHSAPSLAKTALTMQNINHITHFLHQYNIHIIHLYSFMIVHVSVFCWRWTLEGLGCYACQ